MASLYDLGEGVYVRASFTNPTTGAPLDPTTVTLRVLKPSDPPGSPTVTVSPAAPIANPAVGSYEALLTANEVGLWQYRWEGLDTAPAIQEGSFVVRRTELA